MIAVNNIEFLSSYHKELKRISKDIKANLHILDSKLAIKQNNVLRFVKFSKLNNSWLPIDYREDGESNNLKILGEKLCYMIEKGRANDIKPMIKAIIRGKVKKLTHKKICGINEGDFLGYGHFRWDFKAVTLNDCEIKRLRDFFKL